MNLSKKQRIRRRRRKLVVWIGLLTGGFAIWILGSLVGPSFFRARPANLFEDLVADSEMTESVSSDVSSSKRLRVLTLNIHHGRGLDGRIDLRRIADQIQSVHADIVAMQEVDVNTRRSGNVDQAARLAELTGMHVVFGRAKSHSGGKYGNAILSRWPIESSHVVDFPRPFPSSLIQENRSVVIGRVMVDTQALDIYSTHFDFFSNPEARILSAQKLNAILEDRCGASNVPAVLLGDFNARPGQRSILEIRRNWSHVRTQNPLPTFPSDDPIHELDHLFVSPNRQWQARSIETFRFNQCSDHCGLLAELVLQTDLE